jgi:hypothetical protein
LSHLCQKVNEPLFITRVLALHHSGSPLKRARALALPFVIWSFVVQFTSGRRLSICGSKSQKALTRARLPDIL